MNVSIFVGDIADAPAEAICTSTNPRLSLMMGTGASVRERGGFEVLRECEAIVAAAGRPLPPGSTHVTSAGKLPAKVIIHCVACDTHHLSSPDIVAVCVKNALARADEARCRSIALPVFATGHARVKFDRAIAAMADALRTAQTSVEEVLIVISDPARAEQAKRLLASPHPQPATSNDRGREG
jgi:O-acetyl-ADP-ribose deacetylase (regulator of RNase III)